jgi:hypothetical protein
MTGARRDLAGRGRRVGADGARSLMEKGVLTENLTRVSATAVEI